MDEMRVLSKKDACIYCYVLELYGPLLGVVLFEGPSILHYYAHFTTATSLLLTASRNFHEHAPWVLLLPQVGGRSVHSN